MNTLLPLCLKTISSAHKIFILGSCFIFFLSFNSFAQGPGSLFVDAGPDVTVDCNTGTGCANITANFLETFETISSNYTVESITYNPPFPFNGLANSINITTDDTWSPVDTLPYDFCFFENIETQFQVGSNGVVRFDVDPGDTTNGWSFSENLPNNSNPTLGEANVFTPVHDIHPSINPTNEIGYEVLGTFPNRVLVVSYYEVAMFSGACNNMLATQMVVFYEFSNVIEIYMQDKPVCTTWNSGNAALGIQNNDGNIAFVPPGRNTSDSPWTANNEAWRFTPAGVETYVFEWLDANGTVISTNPTVEVCPVGTEIFTARVTYTNCNGDTVILTDDVAVTAEATFSVELGENQEFCDTPNYNITAEIIDGDPNDATFLWSTGETTQTITVSTSNTYTVDVTIGGCTVTESVDVTFNEVPNFDLGTAISTCILDNIVLDATPSNYNISDVTFEWSLDGNVLTGETSNSLLITTTGTYSVVVDYQGCIGEDSITVAAANDIDVSLGPDFSTCFNEIVVLDATPSNYDLTLASFQWSFNGTILTGESSATLIAEEPGNYNVIVSIGVCSVSESIEITPSNDIELSLGDDIETCFDEEIILDASPSNYDPTLANYQWSLNGTVIEGETLPTLVVSESGAYSVIVSIGACTGSDSIVISGRDDLIVTINEDFKTCPDEIQTLTANTSETDVTYQWYLNGDIIVGATDSVLEISVPSNTVGEQIYSVTISVGDCSGSDDVSVVLYDVGKCTISQGLSPNGDGMNDCLDLEFISDRTGAFSVEIFNRYGMSVFSQDNYVNEFCGIDQDGNELTTGTYFYVMKFATPDPVYGDLKTGWVYINKEVK
ncbi:gliding motility-associated C-terminal domain-containing protein [Aureisphaera sp. CAU 1614]|uniref:Gliding motility-associated C-terminal domain-containing protein n=1 Tax=Halomarinibacterium sedimenti TaxID=2857106 RepID=A0A9X1FM36_9FLAO|nr:gliding motility-associated C-terminal domain-containing protein [Halomarinibacterium sedimenti]MBW2937106.1 gliding motility-associated C-terminal domain-containing protein [Halomarinibacterium sedimenti]